MKCRRHKAMTLVEVTMAIGIITFCAVGLMGLLPVMLNTARESRETTIVTRIHQAVAADLRENFATAQGPWFFNQEGLRIPSATDAHYRANTNASAPTVIGDSTNPGVLMIPLTVENIIRNQTSLTRPIFIQHEAP